jgi:hypothetical protein
MIRAFLFLVLALSAGTCLGQDAKADAAYGVRYVQERVVELPQDQFKPYLTVFGSEKDARFKALVKSFDENPTLKAIKDQCHFNAITHESDNWIAKYSAENPKDLVVKMQAVDADMTVVDVTVLVGNQIPMTGDSLAKLLNRESMKAECFRRKPIIINNNNLNVVPNTDPPAQPLLPPSKPDNKPAKTQGPLWPSFVLVGLASMVGVFLGVRRKWRETYLK